uniref:Neur_chan_LBD domain-containing protein n=1 Tax=Macrostomum lignano TaxID=282301 RepID=A0A1I8FH26_9PLAT
CSECSAFNQSTWTDEQRLLHRILSSYDPASRPTIHAGKTVEVRFQIAMVQISQLVRALEPRPGRVKPDEQRLMEAMMQRYDASVRPVINASDQVTVTFGFALILITDMDEVNQVLTTNVWLEQRDLSTCQSKQEWHDERLHWDPKDYNGARRWWTRNGTVFWPPPAKLRSTCKIDITYFPFDDQICTMKFGSWTYDGYQVNISKKREEVDFQNYVQSGEWNLIRIDVERQETVYPISPVPYPDIKFHIVIRRRTLYYLFNIIFPACGSPYSACWDSGCHPTRGRRSPWVSQCWLAFSVFMLLIAENMPATSEFVPLIGIYLTVTMSTTSLSIVLTVFVLHLHHIGPNDKPVPPRLKHFFFNLAARMLCMSSVARYQKRARKRRQKFEECRQQQQQPEEVELLGTSTSPQPAVADQQPRKSGSCNGQFLTAADDAIMEEDNRRGTIANRGATDDSPTASAATAAGPSGLARPSSSNRLLCCSDASTKSARLKKRLPQLLINDWRMLAFIVDRMLFWLFLVAAFGSTIVILVIMPLFKEVA